MPGAPVDADGNPVYHHMPKSYEAAKTDGERWRWMLAQVVEFEPKRANEMDMVFANFLREQFGVLHRQLLDIVRHDEVCRRLMTTPGVGPVVALTFRATVDVPSRFTSSTAAGAAFGLTPRRRQSGEIDRMGGISKCGDAMMREMLFEAALVLMTHSRK